jgi:outer membrane biogenesis lipoprotein LolB
MRHLLSFLALALLAGCASSGGRPEDVDYSRDALLQSVSAYQICAEEHKDDLKECDGIAKLENSDEKRLERFSSQK